MTLGTLLQYLTNGPAAGTTASTSNTGANTLTTSGGTESFVADSATGRTKLQLQTTTGGSSLNARYYMDASSAQVAVTVKLTTPATTPSGELQMLSQRYGTTSGGRCFSIAWEASGVVRFLDSTNTVTQIAAAGVLSLATEYVFAYIAANAGAGGAGNGSATVHIYNVGGTTPIATANVSGANFTANQFGTVDIGGGTIANTIDAMDLQIQGGQTTEIPDYVPSTPLTTPVVTLGTVTNPSTVGGSNGSAGVSWPAVSNASSYDAYVATKASPAQSDFSKVSTGVTSPYTFPGLAAGTYSFGIVANP